MPAKQLLFGPAARLRLLAGVDVLARAVTVTLGPRGRNVAIAHGGGPPLVTKDGVTVADAITLPDPFADLGAQLVKEVAARTSRVAGDGTTTATVLAAAIFHEGLTVVSSGANPLFLKRGIDLAVEAVVAELGRQSRPVDGHADIQRVATLSANSDSATGAMIADALDRVGRDGAVAVEAGRGRESTLKVEDGLRFVGGYLSSYFVTDTESMQADLEDAWVLIVARTLSQIQPLLPILQAVAATGRPLLLVSENVDGDALSALVVNRLRGILRVCAVRPTTHGEQRAVFFADLALLTEGHVHGDAAGGALEALTLRDLGRAARVVVDIESTTVIGGAKRPVALTRQLTWLREHIETERDEVAREGMKNRLARLAGGVAVISVGASTEAEMMEKKARFDDALGATRAAVAQGIVAGGGVALLRCGAALDRLRSTGDEALGVAIVRRSLSAPLRSLCANAGMDGAVVVEAVAKGEGAYGYNVATGIFEDLITAGVVDPTRVAQAALRNAASIAGLLLTTDCLIVDAERGAQPDGSG